MGLWRAMGDKDVQMGLGVALALLKGIRQMRPVPAEVIGT
jgi:Protein of unknown function (DUF1641).